MKLQRRPPSRDELGATAVEYGLMVGFIAMAIVATVRILGITVAGGFQPVVDALAAFN